MQNREEASRYLEEIAGKGIVLGLDAMKELLYRLGNPQNHLQFVQVAGTNGKGSVTAYVANILSQAGYRTGRYTSPAVFTPEETIQVSAAGQFVPVSSAQYIEGVEALQQVLTQMAEEKRAMPTQFELETALAFWVFARTGCQIAVIETGMGGDMDATNVVETTVCSLLASISLDHQKFLGDTLEKIAFHKAGIIKPGRPAVLMGQSKAVEETVQKFCEKQGSPLIVTSRANVTVVESTIEEQIFTVPKWGQIHIFLPGVFQIDNALVALEAASQLQAAGYHKIDSEAVRKGMAETVWQGRLQVLERQPVVLLDGAHNPDAAEKLVQTLEKDFTNTKFLYIMGVLADKDYAGVIGCLVRNASGFITLTPKNNRALPAEQLAEAIHLLTEQPVTVTASISEGVHLAKQAHKTGQPVVFCGSLSFLGEIEQRWHTDGT